MRFPIFIFLTVLFTHSANAQGCCSGGCGSPIAGGGSVGVLALRQLELSSSFQHIYSDRFLTEDRDTAPLFDHFTSQYIYSKLSYGITNAFTFSAELGYFIKKSQIGNRDPITGIAIDSFNTKGIADLILFPKYKLYDHSDSIKKIEFTFGMGYKLPLGKYNDSTVVYHNPFNGKDIYAIMPPIVQPTNGSQDLIFYGLFLRGFPKHDLKLFATGTYIKKGWSPLGFKFGDYAGIGINAGKTFLKKLSINLQLRYEWIDSISYNDNIDMVALYNIYVNSTGNKKLALIPQLSYSHKDLSIYGLYEVPIYEYVNGSQMRSKTIFTVGLSYRFFATKYPPIVDASYKGDVWECPMKCESLLFSRSGKCKVCRMDLIKK